MREGVTARKIKDRAERVENTLWVFLVRSQPAGQAKDKNISDRRTKREYLFIR